ncbi:MAG: FAD-binding protein [Coriobacteriia bacterium]|nr:FAD-binding protein [Coriobacteriia bacterium]
MKKEGNESSVVSRRQFLTGVGVGALGLASVGLVGCSASKSSAETTATGSTANSWLGAEPTIAADAIKETITTQVLVVGGGTGGLFAFCSALENGAKALLIDKTKSGGGIRDDLGSLNSSYQKAAGTVIDKQEIVRELVRYSASRGDQRLYMLWADESAETIDWYGALLAKKNVKLWHEAAVEKNQVNYKHFPTGHSPAWPKDEKNVQTLDGKTVLTEYAKSLGGEIRWETSMVKLIKGTDRITGVIAKTTAGTYIQINASKGVIVCTGGYAENTDMLKALQPESLSLMSMSSAIPGSMGDGIKACIWAGAKFDDIHTSMLFDRCALKPSEVGGPGATGPLFWMGSQPFLKVNLNGERFANESGTYDGILHAAAEQPMSTYCTIWDSNFQKDVVRFDTHGCSRMFAFDNGAPPNIPLPAILGMLDGLMQSGHIQKADTPEELATKLNIPSAAFAATVKRYNTLNEQQKDVDFGKEAFRLSALKTPPFYGVRQTGMMLCTLDGIRTDTNMNATDDKGKAIKGLYVCGNDSGGYWAHTYPSPCTGVACGRTVTFARRAGRIAAKSA